MIVTCEDEGIWRLRFLTGVADDPLPDGGLLNDLPGLPVRLEPSSADSDVIELSAGGGPPSVHVRRIATQIEFLNRAGGVDVATHPEHPFQRDIRSGHVAAYFTRQPGDLFFGLGEKSGGIVKNGRVFLLGAADAAGYESEFHDPLYKHIPFILIGNRDTRRFTGLFFRTAWEGLANLGATIDNYFAPDFHVRLFGGPLDVYVFAGPAPADVIERYTRLTGRTMLPPKFTLGYLASGFDPSEQPRGDERIIAFAKTAREKDLPCDGWHLSSGYTVLESTNRRCVFHWNAERFPDPAGFFRRMNELGVRVAANVKPALLLDHPLYAEAATGGFFVRDESGQNPLVTKFWGGDASFIDFTNPAAREWWIDKLSRTLLAAGLNGVWNDNCEFSIYRNDAVCLGDDKPYPAGGQKTVMTNLMVRASHEAFRRHSPDLRPWIVSRAGWAGIQSLAQTWSGDNSTSWHELKWNIPVGLGMGLSGVANESHDVGGFCGPRPDPELFARWCQSGIFMPRFTVHSSGESYMEPWTHADVFPIVRDAIKFRYQFMPLLYSLFDDSRRTGAPIQRPLLWCFPDQPDLWNESFQFMFGDHLLVAPVTAAGAVRWPVRLPARSRWIDWFTGASHEGGRTIEVDTPLDRFVLLLRDGAVVPAQKVVPFVGSEPIMQIDLHLTFPRYESSAFILYEDDGETRAHERGVYHRRRISFSSAGSGRFRLEFAPAQGTFAPSWKTARLIFHETARTARIASDGRWASLTSQSGGCLSASVPYDSGAMAFDVEI